MLLCNSNDLHKFVCVIDWPSTELTIKRCTWLNKRKNCGSKWAWENNITRCPGRFESVGDRMPAEWEPAPDRGLGSSVTHGWATPAKMRKKCCYGREKNLGQNNSLSPSPPQLSHTRNITLSRIKCERYIFCKEVYSFVIEVVITVIVFPYIFVCAYKYIRICMWLYNICFLGFMANQLSHVI